MYIVYLYELLKLPIDWRRARTSRCLYFAYKNSKYFEVIHTNKWRMDVCTYVVGVGLKQQ